MKTKRAISVICVALSVLLIAISFKIIIDAPLMAYEYVNSRFERQSETVIEKETGTDYDREYARKRDYIHAKVLFHGKEKYSDSIINTYATPDAYTEAYRTVGILTGALGIMLFIFPLKYALKKE